MPRPGRRAVGLVFGAFLLFAVGTNVQAGWVLVIASLLLGAALAGYALPAWMVRGVTVERRAPAEATAGESVPVDLVVANAGRRSKLSVMVHDPFVAPAWAFVPSLGPHGRAVIATLRSPARRGVADGTTVTIASSAPFGVSTARRRIPVPGRTVVHPRSVALRTLPVLDRPARPEQAPLSAPRHGHGQDFLGVREFRTGDSLRHVHWPSTARHGTLIVREFEREEPRRLAVLVDTWADSGPDDPESALDLGCAAAASAVRHAEAAGSAVGLAAGRDGAGDVLRLAGRGAALAWLAELRAPGGVGLDRLADGLRPLGFPEAVLAIVPTWEANAERASALVAGVSSSGARLQVLLVDASSFGAGPARALDRAAAERLAAWMRSRGAIVGLVRAGEDLAAALAASLEPAVPAEVG